MKKYFFIISVLILSIMSSCKKFPDLGDGYRLDYSGRSNYIQIEYSNEIIIGDNVVNYNYNSEFILAVQKPPDNIPKQKHYSDWKKVYEKNNFKQYWIIDKNQKAAFNSATKSYSNVYGPLNKEEFLNKIEKLKIPNDLKIPE